jgi:SHS2 domain-containing protein
VFRWVGHTAELELEIEAPSKEAVFGEALAALTELIEHGSGPTTTRELEVESDEPALLLAEWLSELVYLADAEQFVPERIAALELGEDSLRATIEGHVGEPRPLVKAVTLHRLEFQPDDTVGWRARVVLDV